MESESNWLDSFYEALEFFYWEPQHIFSKSDDTAELEALAKVVKKASRAQDVKKHLRKMEVTLNHNIRQFFLLAPDVLRNGLFTELFLPGDPANDRRFDGAFDMQGREVDTDFQLANTMQPDFLFVSKTATVAIEMKVKAKCSVEQVLKYALLGLAVEIFQGPKKHYLVLLGRGSLAKQFRERFESEDKLKDAVAKKDLTSFLLKKPDHFRNNEGRLKQVVETMSIKFLTYERFAQFLRDAKPLQSDKSPGAEVYRKLISGLVAELELRKLS